MPAKTTKINREYTIKQLRTMVRDRLGLETTKDIKKVMSLVVTGLDLRCWDSWNNIYNTIRFGAPVSVKIAVNNITNALKSAEEQRAADYEAIQRYQTKRNANQYRTGL